MMFLEYFIWSAWYVTLGAWLGIGLHFNGTRIGLVAGTTAIAAIISPLLLGALADHVVSAERLLAILHSIGGVLLLFAARQHSFPAIYCLFLAYSICYMPTMPLTNAICFRHIQRVEDQFAGLRVFGTLGWIVAGIIVSYAGIESTAVTVKIAAITSFVMAAYSLTLPSTPPTSRGARFSIRNVIPIDALYILRKPSFLIFLVASFLICIPLQFYAFTNLYLNEIGVQYAAAKMTLGQMSELVFMLLIPWFFRRLGVKYMLALGMFAWVIRYAGFAYGNDHGRMWILYAGLLLHGVCYDFFFVSGQIYVDNSVPLRVRAAAQGLITFVTYGAGMLAGSWLSGRVVDQFTSGFGDSTMHNWRLIWLTAAVGPAVVLLGFLALFHDKTNGAPHSAQELATESALPL
jgi:nucleoside transporter